MQRSSICCVALLMLFAGSAMAQLATGSLGETPLTIQADGDPSEWFAEAALDSTTEGAITVTSNQMLVFNDAENDDLGDGDYGNPTNAGYGNESDLRELRMAINGDGWHFLLVHGAPTTGLGGSDPDSAQFITPAGTIDGAATTSTGPSGAPSPVDLSGVLHAFNNTNTAGVAGDTLGTLDANGPTANTGFEFFLPAAALERPSGFNPGDTINIFAIVTGSTGYKSNQTLPGQPGGTTNPGTTTVDFTATGAISVTVGAGTFGASGITIDGSDADNANYTTNVVQTITTQFGDNFSELDEAWAAGFTDGLALAIMGNLETNGNGLLIFIDSVPAQGETVIANTPGALPRTAGMNGDTLPIAADVSLEINANGGTNYYIDWSDLDSAVVPTFAGIGNILLSTQADDGSGLGDLDTRQFSEGSLTRSTTAAADTAYEIYVTMGGNNADGFVFESGGAGAVSIQGQITGVNSFNEGITVDGGNAVATEFTIPAVALAQAEGLDPFASSLVNLTVVTGFSGDGGAVFAEISDVASDNEGAGGTSGYEDFDAYDLLSTSQVDQSAEIAAGVIDTHFIGITQAGITQTAISNFALYR